MPAAESLETAMLGHLFGSSSWTKPATLYIAALITTPADVEGLVEVSAAEYARIQRDPSDANWLAQADNSRINAAAIEFADPLTDWGTVKAVGLFDSATSGNLLAWQDLDAAKAVTAGGAVLVFQPGALSWKMNDV
ncbi:MAG: hypothetical protein RBR03_09135 [Desulfuromonas thiophila]|jgi:hypothetical protein|nr:hypothetical protein [Desulfuromonas thiophila]MDY0398809.1 hypothetical protein [Desulfuromonas thiophila]